MKTTIEKVLLRFIALMTTLCLVVIEVEADKIMRNQETIYLQTASMTEEMRARTDFSAKKTFEQLEGMDTKLIQVFQSHEANVRDTIFFKDCRDKNHKKGEYFVLRCIDDINPLRESIY